MHRLPFLLPLEFAAVLITGDYASGRGKKNTSEVVSQFALMRSEELVKKRTLLHLQARLAKNLEPDRNSSAAEPSAALEEAHMALIFGRGVHHHDLLIIAAQRGK